MTAIAPGAATGRPSIHVRSVVLAVFIVALIGGAHASTAGAATLVELGSFAKEAGTGAGQFRTAQGLVVNRDGAGEADSGDVYVGDRLNNRIQQFTSDGEFIRTWGKNVNATQPGTGFEICTAASGDVCQAGTASVEAGALNVPSGVAIDRSTGNLFVTDTNNRRIAVYSAVGEFQGAFGWGVNQAAPAEGLQFCTAVTGCLVGKTTGFSTGNSTGSAGAFSAAGLSRGALSIDQDAGTLWVGDTANRRINEFMFQLTGEQVTGVSFVRALGWNINASAPAEALQQCTVATGCKAGVSGAGNGQIVEPISLAVDDAGNIFVSSVSGTCSASAPCRVFKFSPSGGFEEIFGPSSGASTTCQLNWTSGTLNANGAYWLSIEPTSQRIFVARKTSTTGLELCEFDPDGALVSQSPATPLPSNNVATPRFDFGADDTVYLSTSLAADTSWPVTIFGYVPPAPAAMSPVTDATATSATLKGEVTVPKPGGQGFDVTYRFEYSPDNGLTWLRAPVEADASVGTNVSGTYLVQQSISGLLPNTTYRARLVTTTSYVTTSAERTFSTGVGLPEVTEMRARDASQNGVTVEAQINPRGTATTYRIEWGPTVEYGNSVPAGFEPYVGSGNEPTRVTAPLTGLAAKTRYHYRVVATNAAGTFRSPDQIAETLNRCKLPDDRCLELVSPRDPGPVALPNEQLAGFEMPFQAADSGGKLAYEAELGYPGKTTIGGEALYIAERGGAGWGVTQYTPALTEPTEGSALRGKVLGLSSNLECGVLSSKLPLTSDPAGRLIIEAGGTNLYRRDGAGSYTLITALPPEVLGPGNADTDFDLIGMSSDCGIVVFSSPNDYPGVPGVGYGAAQKRLYEWDHGVLRNVGWVPDGLGGELAVAATGGNPEAGSFGNIFNAVSDDGSRTFFSATRASGNNPGEAGKTGVFARIDGETTLDVSLSQTSTPAGDAIYQGATPDGSRVYFTASAGLTAETSSEGRDLYECRIVVGIGGEPECELTDLSVDQDPGGAEAGGDTGREIGALVGLSGDASRVYFLARGQLVDGRGPTFAANKAAATFSLYEYDGTAGSVRFVAVVGAKDVAGVTTGELAKLTSRTAGDGRYLLFESSAEVTRYDSGGRRMAYLYDSEAESEPVVCVSCPQDGEPTRTSGGAAAYPLVEVSRNLTYLAQSLVVRNGEPRVVFRSLDRLADGGIAGEWGLYLWAHGQVFHVANDLPGGTSSNGNGTLNFAGASADGTDIFFVDSAALNWENPEARRSVWVARVGGGFDQPPPVVGCNAVTEGSCQGPALPSPAIPGVGSTVFSGPGNVKSEPKPKKKKKKKQKKKQKSKNKGKSKSTKQKAKKRGKQARSANDNRGAGK